MPTQYKQPSIGYPGGKSKIAKQIIAKMPPHKVYVEPFAGAAHVFFQKPKAPKNVLNDKNKELVKFLNSVKDERLCCKIRDTTKEKFIKVARKQTWSPCDYLYLNRTSFGSKTTAGGRITYAERKKKLNQTTCIDGSKLHNVTITSHDFRPVIRKYDSKSTLFYIDPPYVKANEKACLYGKKMCDVTPQEVASAVRKIEGKAIVSYDDHPDVRQAFKGFRIEKITIPYSLAKKSEKTKGKTKELLIKNF